MAVGGRLRRQGKASSTCTDTFASELSRPQRHISIALGQTGYGPIELAALLAAHEQRRLAMQAACVVGSPAIPKRCQHACANSPSGTTTWGATTTASASTTPTASRAWSRCSSTRRAQTQMTRRVDPHFGHAAPGAQRPILRIATNSSRTSPARADPLAARASAAPARGWLAIFFRPACIFLLTARFEAGGPGCGLASGIPLGRPWPAAGGLPAPGKTTQPYRGPIDPPRAVQAVEKQGVMMESWCVVTMRTGSRPYHAVLLQRVQVPSR